MADEDKTERILDNFPKFLKRDTESNNYTVTKSFSTEMEVFDDNSTSMAQDAKVSTATGDALDSIGELFLLPRNGSETDALYRARILAYWSSLLGGGTNQSLSKSISAGIGLEETDVIITDISTAIFEVDIPINDLTVLEVMNILQALIGDIKAAGTYLKAINFISDGGIFRTNLSKYNGVDTFL